LLVIKSTTFVAASWRIVIEVSRVLAGDMPSLADDIVLASNVPAAVDRAANALL
jgi:hypothetical protein